MKNAPVATRRRTCAGTIASAIAVACIVGCNNNDTTTPSTPDYSGLALVLDPSHLTLPQGGAQTVTLHLVRTGTFANALVHLSTGATPSGLTLTFDTTDITTDTATLTVTASANAPVGAASATILAAATNVTATSPLAINVTAPSTMMTVSGQVVDQLMLPVGWVDVAIWSKGAPTPITVTSAIDGRFAATGVVPPYDLVISTTMTSGPVALVYPGLSRPDVFIMNPLGTDVVPSSTNFAVALPAAIPGGQKAYAAYQCWSGQGSADMASQNQSIYGYGFFGAAEACSVFALQGGVDGDGFLTSFAFGEVTATAAGGTTAQVSADLSSESTLHTATITVNASTGNISDVQMLWMPSPSIQLLQNLIAPPAGSFVYQFVVPNAPATNMVLTAEQTTPDSSRSVITVPFSGSGVADATLTIPTAPTLSSPADGSTMALPISFTVSGTQQAAYLITIAKNDNSYAVVVAAPSGSFSSTLLDKFGLSLPADSGYRLTAVAYGSAVTIDDLASSKASAAALAHGTWQATSPVQSFNTSP